MGRNSMLRETYVEIEKKKKHSRDIKQNVNKMSSSTDFIKISQFKKHENQGIYKLN